jgi:hypothetical protein
MSWKKSLVTAALLLLVPGMVELPVWAQNQPSAELANLRRRNSAARSALPKAAASVPGSAAVRSPLRGATKKTKAPDSSIPFLVGPNLFATFGENAQSVTTLDIDRDGTLDLVVLNQCQAQFGCSKQQEQGAIGLLIGAGDGTFQPMDQLSTLGYSYPLVASSIVAADLNGDGFPDLVVTNQCGDDPNCFSFGTVYVVLNTKSGMTVGQAPISTGAFGPYSIAVGDVNGDGKPDLVVANACDASCAFGAVSVLLGNGDGTFQPALVFSSGDFDAYSVALGDFNGDGLLDIAVANNNCPTGFNCTTTEGSVGILLGNGDGTFQPAQVLDSMGLDPDAIAVADLNGDGKADLIVANQCDTGSNCTSSAHSIAVMLGNGDGTFQAATTFDSGGFIPASINVKDMDGDGKLDLVISNTCEVVSICQSGMLGILMGNGDGSFQDPQRYVTFGSSSVAATIADFNKDGGLDVAVANTCASCFEGVASIFLRNTTITTLTASPTNPSYGTSVTLTASVTGLQGTPTGSVTITEGASTLGVVTLSSGQGSSSIDNLPAGTHQLIAIYSGDSSFPQSVSKPMTLIVSKVNSTCALSSSIDPSLTLQGVLFTATIGPAVSSDAVGPSGAINFYDASTLMGSTTLSALTASLSVPSFSAGSHPITISYSGDSNFTSCSSSILTQQVNLIGTQTTVTSSANPSLAGQPLTLTATLAPAYPGNPGGTVTFYDGATVLGTGTVAGNVVSFTTSSLSTGSHSITAVYSGDLNFNGSTSGALNEAVQNGTATTLASSLNPSTFGQQVIFTATVSSAGGTPQGTVTFTANNKFLGTVKLISGSAILGVNSLNTGSTPILATYAGSNLFHGSTGTVVQVVNGVPTVTTITGSTPNPSVYGQQVTFTATVTATSGTPTGTVRFRSGTTQLGQATLVNGTASIITTPGQMIGGADAIVASYAATGQFAASVSPTFYQTVTQTSDSISLTSTANPSTVGQTVSFTATVTGAFAVPKGNVRFLDGTKLLAGVPVTNGVAVYTTTVLASGSHAIKAMYMGDMNYSPNNTSLQQTVQ